MKKGLARYALPFSYLVRSRLGSIQDRISWLLIHPVPVLWLVVCVAPLEQWPARILLAVIALFAFQSVYEIGYLENDSLTVRSEKDPTLRLAEHERLFVETNLPTIAAARAALFGLSLSALVWLASRLDVPANAALFSGATLLAMLAFLVHNRLRSRVNVASYLVLSSCRYLAVPLLLGSEGQRAEIAFAAFLMMPLVRSLEHACKPKYRLGALRRLMTPFTSSRAVYYVLAASGFALTAVIAGWSLWPGLILAYFFAYRVVILVMVRRGLVSPTRHGSYEA